MLMRDDLYRTVLVSVINKFHSARGEGAVYLVLWILPWGVVCALFGESHMMSS